MEISNNKFCKNNSIMNKQEIKTCKIHADYNHITDEVMNWSELQDKK